MTTDLDDKYDILGEPRQSMSQLRAQEERDERDANLATVVRTGYYRDVHKWLTQRVEEYIEEAMEHEDDEVMRKMPPNDLERTLDFITYLNEYVEAEL